MQCPGTDQSAEERKCPAERPGCTAAPKKNSHEESSSTKDIFKVITELALILMHIAEAGKPSRDLLIVILQA